ncbi:hypothetical protein KM031_06295 [Gemmobacter fulvus]|uniref:Putative glutamine amidotransferase domain-containing protein n=1 Tax=Gemmobacter fulvus TaxID=2840474 RepID=A0A975S1R9_9RHOB|nr:glutamine amidotransferase [Gemmobacter fulvus]MBT9244630.1 hypothetical protein [Gemmobacter fulvus]QWK91489.1 hypothetical protein KM031_06295 [Gemmobacter fulvus]
MTGAVILDPHLPLLVIAGLAMLAVLLTGYALWRGLAGWLPRAAAAFILLVALANPSLQQEDRAPLTDIVIAVVDESSSQTVGTRPAQTAAALARLRAEVASLPNTELREVTAQDAPGDGGTPLMAALAEALAEEPRARVAGAVLITDGQVHDLDLAPQMPAPLHVLLTGETADWDRRLIIRNAPAFAILGEPVALTLRVEDQGQVPEGVGGTAQLSIAVDGGPPDWYDVPVGEDLELPVTLPHGGQNIIQFQVAVTDGELTDRNNASVTAINGVRDRLRVLLVSGEPHAGERVWRNLLKSDPSVDLVHFTILRPPEKQDGIPVEELSLIAFPTRELFVEKIDEFDLIIFDRYRLRGILPTSYLENVRDYVTQGGTVLVAAGPEFGTADSLWRSPLADILPVDTTSRVLEGGFRPKLTDLGQRHPVTQGLEALGPKDGWGRWFRQIEISARGAGQVVMQGAEGKPLLVLAREGEGRVAVLASDHAWLWGRGYEGGGPQLELLRRLAHWMLKEPDLEEEILTALPEDQTLAITRRTVSELDPGPVTITLPDGTTTPLVLPQIGPGHYAAEFAAPMVGLYRLQQGTLETVVAVGPPAPKEFEETIASGEKLAPIVAASNGGILRIEAGTPDVRAVGEGRAAAGRGWIGITPRGAYVTQDIRVAALLPGWAYLLLAAALALTAWLREGRFAMGRHRAL